MHETSERKDAVGLLSRAPVALSLVAPLITVLIVAGGWLYTQGKTSERIDVLESRVTKLEETYIPTQVHMEKDRLRDEEFEEMKAGHEELQKRLERIETKIDSLEVAVRDKR